ncbi:MULTISPECIES: ABC transporter ATP-binding protein [Aerococcus]|nr:MULTISPECIES: ATP-binding cassette domain-containing protein [Aerococcus]MDK7050465.1 ATP-binding cassette domain-containing protein [Aerococcus sanguinicola]
MIKMTDYIIESHRLSKVYKDFVAVDQLSLHVSRGSIYGLLGPNGSGKSTTMKMLLGLTAPSSGDCQIDGLSFPKDRQAILHKVGALIEAPSYYANLSGRENLDLIRRILDLAPETVDQALNLVDLGPYADRLVRHYSLGMKQRLGIASALIGQPPLLILDEPTNGLDPAGIHEIRQLILSLPERYGCTVLISSHLLSEMEQMVDDLCILNRGRQLYEGSLRALKDRAAGQESLEDLFLEMVMADNRGQGGSSHVQSLVD